jgi:hypothetical protein
MSVEMAEALGLVDVELAFGIMRTARQHTAC